MKVYLAAPWGERGHMRDIAAMLERAGIVVTSRWLASHDWTPEDGEREEYERQCAMVDIADIAEADVLVVTTIAPANRGGRYVEMGYALALGKPVVVVGPASNVFCRLPEVELVPTWEGAIASLCRMMAEALEEGQQPAPEAGPEGVPVCARCQQPKPCGCHDEE